MNISELTSYSPSDLSDLSALIRNLNETVCVSRESLDNLIADGNSHFYVIKDNDRIIACGCLCVFHQPFQTDATIESVVVSENHRGEGLGRMLVEYLITEAKRLGVNELHLTSNPKRIAANELYVKLGFIKKETNCYIMKKYH